MKPLLSHLIRIGCASGTVACMALFLQPAFSQAQTIPPSTMQPDPDHKAPQAMSCPIRIDEAYLTADPATLPAQAAAAKRTLHVTLVDVSGKPIVGYTVRARIDLPPAGSLTNAPQTSTVSRRWHGQLEQDTPTKEKWTFSADRLTMGLRRVWFDKVTFADGSIWNKSASDSCSFAATGHIVQTRASTAGH